MAKASSLGSEVAAKYNSVTTITMGVWCAYPVTYLLAELQHALTLQQEVMLYDGLDVFAKCVKLLKDRKALLLSISEDPAKETEILGKLEEVCSLKPFLVLESFMKVKQHLWSEICAGSMVPPNNWCEHIG